MLEVKSNYTVEEMNRQSIFPPLTPIRRSPRPPGAGRNRWKARRHHPASSLLDRVRAERCRPCRPALGAVAKAGEASAGEHEKAIELRCTDRGEGHSAEGSADLGQRVRVTDDKRDRR
jgi:hypothetical protein